MNKEKLIHSIVEKLQSNRSSKSPIELAERIYADCELHFRKAENLPISDVSHQRELLKAFLDWQQNNCTMPYDASISSQIEAWEAFNSD